MTRWRARLHGFSKKVVEERFTIFGGTAKASVANGQGGGSQ